MNDNQELAPFYREPSRASISAGDAEAVLKHWFDWSAPVDSWKPAKVSEMLKYIGQNSNHATSTVFGRVICKLNGGMTKRSHGENLTFLPPLKKTA